VYIYNNIRYICCLYTSHIGIRLHTAGTQTHTHNILYFITIIYMSTRGSKPSGDFRLYDLKSPPCVVWVVRVWYTAESHQRHMRNFAIIARSRSCISAVYIPLSASSARKPPLRGISAALVFPPITSYNNPKLIK